MDVGTIDIFSIFERFITVISPLIIAWYGFKASKSEKQTKKYLESQEELKLANDRLKEIEKKDLQDHFNKLDNSIHDLSERVTNIQATMGKISEIDKRINNLVEMSNVNFEFCTSLSSVISSIGNALDSSDSIDSCTLQNDITTHKKTEQQLIGRMVKIVY